MRFATGRKSRLIAPLRSHQGARTARSPGRESRGRPPAAERPSEKETRLRSKGRSAALRESGSSLADSWALGLTPAATRLNKITGDPPGSVTR